MFTRVPWENRDRKLVVVDVTLQKCVCENYQEFVGEVAIHFPGIKGLQRPIVYTFPKVRVCLECGHADFTVPARELKVLVTGVPTDGAIVLPPRGEIPSATAHLHDDPTLWDGSESDITERKDAKVESEQLTICASCKRICDEQGHWKQPEIYIRDRFAADFSHGCCPECLQTLYSKS